MANNKKCQTSWDRLHLILYVRQPNTADRLCLESRIIVSIESYITCNPHLFKASRIANSKSRMSSDRRAVEIARIKKQELTNKVIQLLHQNKGGLTSFQITKLVGDGIPRNFLLQLQKEGIIVQKRGISGDNKVTFIYVLTKALRK